MRIEKFPEELFENIQPAHQRLLYLCCFLLPFDEPILHNKSMQTKAAIIVKESFKASTKDISAVNKILIGTRNFLTLNENSRLNLGLLLCPLEGLWPISLLLSAIASSVRNEVDKDEAFSKYYEILQSIKDFELENVHLMKPIMDGNEIAALLNISGPNVGLYKEEAIKWQISNPNGTENQLKKYLIDLKSRNNLSI